MSGSSVSARSQAPAWGTGLQQKLCFESEKTKSLRGKRSKSFWYRLVPKLELGNERDYPEGRVLRYEQMEMYHCKFVVYDLHYQPGMGRNICFIV